MVGHARLLMENGLHLYVNSALFTIGKLTDQK